MSEAFMLLFWRKLGCGGEIEPLQTSSSFSEVNIFRASSCLMKDFEFRLGWIMSEVWAFCSELGYSFLKSSFSESSDEKILFDFLSSYGPSACLLSDNCSNYSSISG